jgi:hypothetical protein
MAGTFWGFVQLQAAFHEPEPNAVNYYLQSLLNMNPMSIIVRYFLKYNKRQHFFYAIVPGNDVNNGKRGE